MMQYIFAPLVGILLTISYTVSAQAQDTLSLREAVSLAQDAADPSVEAFKERAAGEKEDAVADSALPDPRVSVGVANLPLDDFSFRRVPMTQVQLGARQAFPRGKTRSLKSRERTLRSEGFSAAAQVQMDTVTRDVSIAWFHVWFSYEAARELEELLGLLTDLSRQQESDFAASGSAALQRIYRTELEQSLVEDRRDKVLQDRAQAVEELARYIGAEAARRLPVGYSLGEDGGVDGAASHTGVAEATGILDAETLNIERIEAALAANPRLQGLEKQTEIALNRAALAGEAYKPEFGVEARYGLRSGNRSDFGSVMLTLDVPLFTSSKQDPALRAAKRRAQAARLERESLQRDLKHQAFTYVQDIQKLHSRISRFEGVTLTRAVGAVSASRSAYGAGNIDFAELVRAEIALRDLRLRRALLHRDMNIARLHLTYIVGEVK